MVSGYEVSEICAKPFKKFRLSAQNVQISAEPRPENSEPCPCMARISFPYELQCKPQKCPSPRRGLSRLCPEVQERLPKSTNIEKFIFNKMIQNVKESHIFQFFRQIGHASAARGHSVSNAHRLSSERTRHKALQAHSTATAITVLARSWMRPANGTKRK